MEDNSLFDKLACDGENWARLLNTPLLELIYYCTFFVLKKDVYSGFQNNSGGGGGGILQLLRKLFICLNYTS